jgi:hypothetical protein
MVDKTKGINDEAAPGEDFEPIQRLIRKEEEAAVVFFQGRDFVSGIKRRIRTESRKKTVKITLFERFRFSSPIPTLAAGLLILLVVVLSIIHLMTPPEPGNDLKQLERIFAQVKFPKPEKAVSTVVLSPEYHALEWRFQQALYSIYLRDENVSEIDLPHIFNKVLYNVPMPDEQRIDLGKSAPPNSRSLERRIQQMIKEKQMYRAFKNILDTQEV